MTKALTKAEKQRRKDERKKKGKQQKPVSPTVKTIQQPARPNLGVNLCDECGYEFGQCEGTPKFASDFDPNLKGAAADRVVECGGFLHIDQLPEDQGRTGKPDEGPGANADELTEEEKEKQDGGFYDNPGGEPGVPQDVQEEEGEGELTPEVEERLTVIKAEAIQRAPLNRFAEDMTDYGACPSCGASLKRTAYSRYVDAIRCVNGRCSAYRNIIKTVPSGAK